ncbi:MAG TPA: hypothetical protein ENJ82_14060 [Bacteroidetes bacterium]|nr:hypothetical protein [Bacteroidota bacterium]
MKTPAERNRKDKKNDILNKRKTEEAAQMKVMSPPPFSLDAGPAQRKSKEEEELIPESGKTTQE